MPWNHNAPDPLEARRRQLAEQERLLSEQHRRLTEQLSAVPDANAKPVEPPVWRMEEDGSRPRVPEPAPARKRNLARQTQRDKFFVLFLILLFIIIVGIGLWVAHALNTAPANGASIRPQLNLDSSRIGATLLLNRSIASL